MLPLVYVLTVGLICSGDGRYDGTFKGADTFNGAHPSLFSIHGFAVTAKRILAVDLQ